MVMPLDQYFNSNGRKFYSTKGHYTFNSTDAFEKTLDRSQQNFEAWYGKEVKPKTLLRTQILRKQQAK